MSNKTNIIPIPRRKRRALLLFSLLLLLIATLLTCFLLSRSTRLDIVKRRLRYRNVAADYGSISFTGSSHSCAMAGDSLCAAFSDRVTTYMLDGTMQSENTFASAPTLLARGDLVLAYEIGGTLYRLLGSDGAVIRESTVSAPIYDADLSEEGSVAILTRGTNSRAVLELYDANGELKLRHSASSRYLNTCAISPDGKTAAATALGEKDLRFASTVLIFEIGNPTVRAERSLESQVIYDMAFLEENRICAVGEKSLQFFEADGTLLRAYPTSEGILNGFCLAKGCVALSYALDEGSEPYGLTLLNAEGKELAYQKLLQEPLRVSVCGSYTALLTPEALEIYDRDLHLIGSMANDGFYTVCARADGTVLCVSEEGTQLFIP